MYDAMFRVTSFCLLKHLNDFFSCIICAGGLVVSGYHSDKVEVEVQFFVGVLVRCDITGYFFLT